MPRVWAQLESDAAAQARAHDRPPTDTNIPALISLGQLSNCPSSAQPPDIRNKDSVWRCDRSAPLWRGKDSVGRWESMVHQHFGGSYSVSLRLSQDSTAPWETDLSHTVHRLVGQLRLRQERKGAALGYTERNTYSVDFSIIRSPIARV